MREFDGKTAAITGAASGIGLAMARTFAAQGMRLALADIEEPALSAAVDSLTGEGAEAFGVATDVSDAGARALRRRGVRALRRRGRAVQQRRRAVRRLPVGVLAGRL